MTKQAERVLGDLFRAFRAEPAPAPGARARALRRGRRGARDRRLRRGHDRPLRVRGAPAPGRSRCRAQLSAPDQGGVQVAFITAPDPETATRLARALVEERLAACVNVVPGVRSIYRYAGCAARGRGNAPDREDARRACRRARGARARAPSLRAARGAAPRGRGREPAVPRLGARGDRAVSLAAALERAAEALPSEADAIRPANGDPVRLLAGLVAGERRARSRLAPRRRASMRPRSCSAPGSRSRPVSRRSSRSTRAACRSRRRSSLRRAQHFLKSQGVRIEAPDAGADRRAPPEGRGRARASPRSPRPIRSASAWRTSSKGIRRAACGSSRWASAKGRASRRSRCTPPVGARCAPSCASSRASAGSLRSRRRSPQCARSSVAPPPRSPPTGRCPATWLEWHSRLDEVPEGAPTPGEFVRDGLGDPGEPLDLEPALAMVRDGRVGPWPEREALERDREAHPGDDREQAHRGGRAPPRADRRADRRRRRRRRGRGGGPGAARIAALFRHTAFVLVGAGRRGRRPRVPRRGRAPSRTRPPAENPLAQALFERPLTGFLEQLEQKEREDAEQGSLIVKPGEPSPGAGPGGIR